MNAAARQLVTATLTAAAALDPTLTADRQAAALDALEGKTIAGIVNSAPMPRIITLDEFAELLHIKRGSVRYYVRKHNIKRVYTGVGKDKKCIGLAEPSVRAFLEKITGDTPAAQPGENKVA